MKRVYVLCVVYYVYITVLYVLWCVCTLFCCGACMNMYVCSVGVCSVCVCSVGVYSVGVYSVYAW